MSTDKPQWAGRVPRHKIARLYETDARGIIDEELIDEVGISLLARAEAILEATRVRTEGTEAVCPKCGETVYHSAKESTVRCEPCDWELPWDDYVQSTRKKQLSVGGIGPFLEEYIRLYPKANTPRKKMIQIDNLLHRYHQELEGGPSRPSAVNLIGGRVHEVMEFLNDLAYSDKSTPGLQQNYARWRKRGRRYFRRMEKKRQREESSESEGDSGASSLRRSRS